MESCYEWKSRNNLAETTPFLGLSKAIKYRKLDEGPMSCKSPFERLFSNSTLICLHI